MQYFGRHLWTTSFGRETRRAIQHVASANRMAQPDFQARLRHANASRHEVYIGMNPVHENSHSRTKADIAAIRHVYLDFDENGTAAVQVLMRRHDVPEPNLSGEHIRGPLAGGVEGRRLRQ